MPDQSLAIDVLALTWVQIFALAPLSGIDDPTETLAPWLQGVG